MVVKTIAIFNVSVIFICARAKKHTHKQIYEITSIKRKPWNMLLDFFKNRKLCSAIASLKRTHLNWCTVCMLAEHFFETFSRNRMQKSSHLIFILLQVDRLFTHTKESVWSVSNKTSTLVTGKKNTHKFCCVVVCVHRFIISCILYARFAPNWIIYNLYVNAHFTCFCNHIIYFFSINYHHLHTKKWDGMCLTS